MAPSSPEPGPSAGPSSSKVTLGPALPPGFTEHNQTIVDDDDDDYHIGPAPPAAGDSEQVLGDGARAFLEREERLRRAEADAQAAKETAASSRPDWMLVPPSASSLTTILSDPKRALKSRGFQQNTRVQARGSLPTGPDPDGMSAWTETPEQRAQRLKDEVEGRRPRLDQEVISQDEVLRAEAQRQKDAEISARIKEIDPARTKSLLDLHRQKRAKEHEDDSNSRSSSKRSDKSRDKDRSSSERKHHDSRSRRHRGSEDDEERSSSSRHRSSRHRDDKERSDEDEDEQERRERRRRKEKRRETGREHRGSDTKDRHSSSSRRHSHSRRSRSPSPSASEPDSEYERERRERKRRKKEKKRKMEEEAEAQKQAGPTGMSKTMIWDREKVMGVGSRVMDERGKAQAIRDAIGLRDRFAGGSGSRFM